VFGIYYGLHRLSTFLDDKNKKDNAASYLPYLVRLVNIIISIITVFANFFLDLIIRLLSAYEKHRTFTKYHLSVAIKLMAATFMNTSILPLFNNLSKNDWFTNNGLAMAIFLNTITVSFLSPLLYLFDIKYIIKKIRICREIRKGAESRMTQRQANQLFEGPKLDMARLYSRTGMLFLMV